MKLNNTLIVTLPDFARHFSFAEFWENRRQFVRDMHPQRVYYWNECLVEAYEAVAAWIAKGEAATEADRKAGCKALETLVGKPVNPKEIAASGNACNFDLPVIRVQTGNTLSLPAYKPGGGKGRLSLECHKIEACGKSGGKAAVCIGNAGKMELRAGDFVYATAVEGGGFVEFLPKKLRNAEFELSLVSQENEFEASLIVRRLCTMQQEVLRGVCSFALTDDGYVYVSDDMKCVIMSNFVLGIKSALMYDGKAFCVKSRGNDVAVLYSDGTLKSIHCMNGMKNVVGVGFDESGGLKIVKR